MAGATPPSRTDPGATGETAARQPAPAISWRRNLAGLWLAQFTAMFGGYFALPFVPLLLYRELHVTNPHTLAFWTGLSGGAIGVSLLLTSPIWGRVADRFGRKRMAIRAIAFGGVTMMAMAAVQTPLQLIAIRLLQGATSGTSTVTTALAATETPRSRVGWALGVLSSAIALGRATGPMVAGLLGTLLSLRQLFVAGGALMLAGTLPVSLLVRESPRPAAREKRPALSVLRSAAPGATRVVGVLIACQMLLQFGYVGAQQLAVLRVIALAPDRAVLLTGAAYGAVGVFTALSALTYSRLIGRCGYRGLAGLGAALLGVGIAGQALAGSLPVLLVFIAASGLVYGAANPSVSSMIGLETPDPIKATVFGVSSSAAAAGYAGGPIVAGLIAAAINVPVALLVTGAVAAAVAVLMLAWGRNPDPDGTAGFLEPAALSHGGAD